MFAGDRNQSHSINETEDTPNALNKDVKMGNPLGPGQMSWHSRKMATRRKDPAGPGEPFSLQPGVPVFMVRIEIFDHWPPLIRTNPFTEEDLL